MINKLIGLLGGVSMDEYLRLNVEYNNQRDQVSEARAREVLLRESLNKEREERIRLQDIIFKRFGVTFDGAHDAGIDPETAPLRVGPQRWSNLKTRLEKDDLKRFNSEVGKHLGEEIKTQ